MLMYSLVLFVFALLGTRIFQNIAVGKFGGIDNNANFQSFYYAITTLWRTATGEDWNIIMHDTMAELGWGAAFYWVMFVLVNVFIFLNIVVAVIFEKLEEKTRMKAANSKVKY